MDIKHTNSLLTIDLKAIVKNYKLILSKLKIDTECAAVIKSNAYSLGVDKIVTKLSSIGCSKFFVANIDEAIYLRSFSLTDEIYVLNGIRQGLEEHFFIQNIIPVLNDVHEVKLWKNFSMRKGRRLPAVINIDTGMNRLGINDSKILDLLNDNNLMKNLKILYLMSHLACAEEPEHPLNKDQYLKIKKISDVIPNIPISFANSSGVFLGKEYHFDLVRVGAALYGLKNSEDMSEFHNVVNLTSTVIQVREITKKSTVGYGASYEVKPGMKLAVVPIGYADGLLYSSSNKGYCFIADVKTPIIGKISMDCIVLDASNVPHNELYPGAEVEVIGNNCSIEQIAEFSSTINYEILASLGQRYKKIYLE